MARPSLPVLVIGPSEAPLFGDLLSVLRGADPPVLLHQFGDLKSIAQAPSAKLVVVLQQWPDEYPPADVLRLIGAAPLARLLVCYGPWCDSDGRTRGVWPLGSRVPLAAAPWRLQQELQRLRDTFPPLPLTANRNETYAYVRCHRPAQHHSPAEKSESLSIAIGACEPVLGGWLEDVLTAAGHSIVGVGTPSADLLLWDADPWGAASRRQLAALRAASCGASVVALCGFPRPREIRELRAAGVAAVILKSSDNGALVECLETVAARQLIVPLAATSESRVRRSG